MSSVSEIAYTLAVWAIPILFAITLHEAAHGWVAEKLGDPTARNQGRITANPIKHIDPVGTVIVPLFLATVSPFVMGWAKPVPVEPRYFKSPLLDMALVAVAGPLSNFIMACIWALFVVLISDMLDASTLKVFLKTMAQNGIIINVILMVLNLLPIPPLDGSRVVAGVLPEPLLTPYLRLERFGMIIILLLLFSGLLGKIMWPMVQNFVNLISTMFAF
jgi:Zn-dependent protease